MKRILGLLALLLGLIGGIGCVAGVLLAWSYSYRYLGQAAEAAREVEVLLSSAENRTDRLKTGVQETQGQIASLGAAARNVAQQGEQSNPADQAKVETFLTKFSSKIERTEDLAQTLRSTAIVLRTGTGLAATLSDDERQTEILTSVEEGLGKTVERLDGLTEKLATARKGEDVRATAKDIAGLTEEIQPVLSAVEKNVSEVDQFLSEARDGVGKIREKILFWKVAGPALATALLAWIALGQACLLAKGWSMLRGEG